MLKTLGRCETWNDQVISKSYDHYATGELAPSNQKF